MISMNDTTARFACLAGPDLLKLDKFRHGAGGDRLKAIRCPARQRLETVTETNHLLHRRIQRNPLTPNYPYQIRR